MNILIFSHYAGSGKHGMNYRSYNLAKEWVKTGHRVTIVAASYNHLHSQHPEISGTITTEIIESIRYLWVKTPEYRGNGLKRVINMLVYTWRIVTERDTILAGDRPEVIVVSSPQPLPIYFAAKFAKQTGARLVFEVRDLWPLTLIELGGMSRWHPFVQMMQITEDFAYKSADKVVSLLPNADSYMESHGLDRDKFVHIPNGIVQEEWNDNSVLPHEHETALKKIKESKKLIVGYTGAHGLANELGTLVQAAKLAADQPVHFVLIGQGPEKVGLQIMARRLGLENIDFLPSVPKASIPAILHAMDILYIGWKREPLYRYGISPNKLMDYMMAGKPVVHSVEAANDIVSDSGCGYTVKPEDPQAVTEAITKLLNLTSTQREDIGKRGIEYVYRHHLYSILANKFLEQIT